MSIISNSEVTFLDASYKLNVSYRDRDLIIHELFFLSSTWRKYGIRKIRSPSPAENEFVSLYG